MSTRLRRRPRSNAPVDGTAARTAVVTTPLGPLRLEAREGRLVRAEFAPRARPHAPCEPLLAEAAVQIAAYFGRRLRAFSVPLAPAGTLFQQRVWTALSAIPYGMQRRYGELAVELGTAARAVGGACRANPLVLFIPCHRVTAVQGTGGYMGARSGAWPALKARLLGHESA